MTEIKPGAVVKEIWVVRELGAAETAVKGVDIVSSNARFRDKKGATADPVHLYAGYHGGPDSDLYRRVLLPEEITDALYWMVRVPRGAQLRILPISKETAIQLLNTPSSAPNCPECQKEGRA